MTSRAMEIKTLSTEKQAQLVRPLPPEAVKPHPTKKYLSSIKSIYVTERLNEVFGVGAWAISTEIADKVTKQVKAGNTTREVTMVVCKVTLRIPTYGIEYECYGGNDNDDLGDAYKGATTDALTKIASWIGIGQEVFKGEAGKVKASPITTSHRKVLTLDKLMDGDFADRLVDWLHTRKGNSSATVESILKEYYEADEATIRDIVNYYNTKYK